MADQNIQIRLIVKDEMSKQLGDITAAANKLNSAINLSGSTGHVNRLTGAVERLRHSFGDRLRREFSSTLSLLGGGIIGGGIVAGLTAATRSITEFAKTSVQLHYQARGLEVSTATIHKYANALKAMGQDEGSAVASITSATSKLRDLQRYGKESELGKWLQEARGGKTLMRELQDAMSGPDAVAGMERGLNLLFERMAGMRLGKGQSPLGKQLGMGPFDPAKLLEIIKKLTPQLEPNIELFERWLVATTNLNTAFGNVQTRMIEAMVPGLEAMSRSLKAFLQSDAGEAFIKKLEGWAADLTKYLGSDQFKTDFKKFSEELKAAAGVLEGAFNVADQVIKALGLTWGQVIGGLIVSQLVPGLGAVALALNAMRWVLPFLPAIMAAAAAYAFFPKDEKELLDRLQRQAPRGGGKTGDTEFFDKYIRPYLPKGMQQQGAVEGDAGGNKLVDALTPLRDELGKLSDNLMSGGPEGKADGTAGYGAGISGSEDYGRAGDVGAAQAIFGAANFPTLDQLSPIIAPKGRGRMPQGPEMQPLGGIQVAGMGSLAGLVGSGGQSSNWAKTLLPSGSFRNRARMERSNLWRSFQPGGMYERFAPSPPGFAEWENAEAPPGYGPGGNLPRPGVIQGEMRPLGQIPDPDWEPFSKGQQFYQRDASFGGIERAINRGIGGDSAPITGSASVDIDIGGVNPGRSHSDGLFRSSNMYRAPQMPQAGGGHSEYNTFNRE